MSGCIQCRFYWSSMRSLTLAHRPLCHCPQVCHNPSKRAGIHDYLNNIRWDIKIYSQAVYFGIYCCLAIWWFPCVIRRLHYGAALLQLCLQNIQGTSNCVRRIAIIDLADSTLYKIIVNWLTYIDFVIFNVRLILTRHFTAFYDPYCAFNMLDSG